MVHYTLVKLGDLNPGYNSFGMRLYPSPWVLYKALPEYLSFASSASTTIAF